MTETKGLSAEPVGLPIDLAPRDGTLLRLLVNYGPEANAADIAAADAAGLIWNYTPFEDTEETAWTIGFNSLDNTGEDEWRFAGWNWSQDCICEGNGKVIGWLPFHDATRSDTVEPLACRECCGLGLARGGACWVCNGSGRAEAQQPALPADVGEVVAGLSELVAFLDGRDALDGLRFGDAPDAAGRLRFWWRAHLKRIDAAIALITAQAGENAALRNEEQVLLGAMDRHLTASSDYLARAEAAEARIIELTGDLERLRQAVAPGGEVEAVAHYACKRCGRDEIDCRANGCERGPCPMEFVG